MQIISGLSNKPLAEHIARLLNCPLLASQTTSFQDGEMKVQVNDPIGSDVVIIQSTSYPANDHLMELLLLIDTAKRAGARHITAVIPYFGYSRQDRCTYKYGPLSASLVVRMLETAGVNKVITLDLHSAQLEGVFSVPITNISIEKIFIAHLIKSDNYVVISPDIGGITRARSVSALLDCDLAIINKSRDSTNSVSMSEIYGNIKGKKCLLVDDIIDSGNTLIKAAQLLHEHGAKSVEACVSHAVLSGNAKINLVNSIIDKIYVSDSVYHQSLPGKFITEHVARTISELIVHPQKEW
jgi:ribose-phosphate pyrophosphokinase